MKKILKNLKNLRVRKYSHIVLLALKQEFDKSYRALEDILDVCTEVLKLLGIKEAPHLTTLQKAAKRLRVQFLDKIMSDLSCSQ